MTMTFNQIEKEFDEKFKCIQSDCDGHGNIPKLVYGMRQISDTECEQTQEWEAGPCQFHEEYLFPFKSFLKQSFIKYLQEQIKYAENKLRFIGGETCCVFCKQHKAAGECNCDGWNDSKLDQINHLQAQIKELQ